MSLTTRQIEELRIYTKDRKGELAKMINDAADTIELLSAKLSAENLERSSQYYHGGWIPCSERLPQVTGRYIITAYDGVSRRTSTAVFQKRLGGWRLSGRMAYWRVTAWMSMPEPYQGREWDEV